MSHDSRNYYDDQFGDRINQIAKPGATASQSGSGGSSGGTSWKVKGGVGGAVVLVFLLIRLAVVASLDRSTPTYPPPTYQPAPITFPQNQFDGQPRVRPDGADDEDNARLMELLRQLQEQREVPPDPNKVVDPEGRPVLKRNKQPEAPPDLLDK